ncbi:hypothetical protein EV426DRAFT_592604 [Tirmania nivea]|nr:hypothetical protein EV426DRAFT_592604 [Tirmania nivea]
MAFNTPPDASAGGEVGGTTISADGESSIIRLGTPTKQKVVFGHTVNFTPGSEEGSTNSSPDTPCPSTGRSIAKKPVSVLTLPAPIPDKVANIQFDADGDVVLVLKSYKGTARFQVNSSILCMLSPVFRAMLGAGSHFKEGKELASRGPGMAPVEVKIEDDDPDVFAVILRILHHQYDSVPKVIRGDKLYKVAILCDKYDLRKALSFVLDKWIPTPHKLPPVILPRGVVSQPDKELFMAYVFGMEEVFKTVSKDLILTYKDMGIFGHTLQFDNVPQIIVDEIMAARAMAIEAIVSFVHQSITLYDNPMRVQCQYGRECCDAFVLGLLIRNFKKMGLYPEASSICMQSVKHIRGRIAFLEQPEFAFFDSCKAVGCCDNPLLCTCKSSRCNNCNHKLCVRCKNAYKLAHEVNHASCAPFGSFVAKATDVVDKIEGLEYSRFVGKKKDEGNNGSDTEANANLWDCLQYI